MISPSQNHPDPKQDVVHYGSVNNLLGISTRFMVKNKFQEIQNKLIFLTFNKELTGEDKSINGGKETVIYEASGPPGDQQGRSVSSIASGDHDSTANAGDAMDEYLRLSILHIYIYLKNIYIYTNSSYLCHIVLRRVLDFLLRLSLPIVSLLN
jgi:hypothetical protein